MKSANITEIAEKMKGIDVGILSTHTEGGEIASRPMSNNGDVTYAGESYFFTYEEARCVTDIERNPKVALGYTREGGIFSGSGVYITIEGQAELIRDRAAFKKHWTPDLDRWFEKGVDTPNLVLLKVAARRITYWEGNEEREAVLK